MRNKKEEAIVTTPAATGVIKVGDKIAVTYHSDGQGKLVRSRESIEEVRAVYLDGSVRIGAGDVYEVEPCASGKAKWQTKFPRKSTSPQL
jgi:hypothetical protein